MSVGFESPTAKAYLIGLAGRASELRRQFLAQEAQARNPIGGSLIDIGIGAFVPHGLKGTSRRFVQKTASGARMQRAANAHEAVNRLVLESRVFASQYSVIPASPSSVPQARSASRRLGSGLDTGSPVVRLLKLEQRLNSLSTIPLIENARIPDYQRHVDFEKAKVRARRAEPDLTPLIDSLRAPESLGNLESRVRPFFVYSPVRDPLEGAIRSLGRGTPEDSRQGLNSLRVAMDALIAELSGKAEWRAGVQLLLSVEEERKILASAHHYFSRASHHGTQFDKSALMLGLDLFVTVGTRLVERSHTLPTRGPIQ